MKKIWNWLFGISSIVGGIIAILPPKPNITYTITNEQVLIDGRALESLEVDSLIKKIEKKYFTDYFIGGCYKVIDVEVKNKGRREVTPAMYNGSLGFILRGPILIAHDSPVVILDKDDNILPQLLPKVSNDGICSRVELPQVLLNPGDSYIVRFIILYFSNTLDVTIEPFGKIAGQKSIKVKYNI